MRKLCLLFQGIPGILYQIIFSHCETVALIGEMNRILTSREKWLDDVTSRAPVSFSWAEYQQSAQPCIIFYQSENCKSRDADIVQN